MEISEFVSLGHPDKIADYISEYILDRLIEQDKLTRYALEVQVKDNFVTLGGEITTTAQNVDYDKWVREAVKDIGYTAEYANYWGNENTINPELLTVTKHISLQSSDIAVGVNDDGWGDQGIMFGMAVNDESTEYLPADYFFARKVCKELYQSGLGGLDIKTQVVMENDIIKKVIVAIPLKEAEKRAEVASAVRGMLPKEPYELIINGTGRYVKHSSMGDCGTTGRKLAVDFYGGNCNVGGGSPWTKDGTKADLTLNLLARKFALDYVRKNCAPYCKCGIGCVIGQKKVDVTLWSKKNTLLDTFSIEMSPRDLIQEFGLDKPIYADLCKHGIFSKIK